MAERILRQKTGDINNKTAKRKAMWFPDISDGQAFLLQGI